MTCEKRNSFYEKREKRCYATVENTRIAEGLLDTLDLVVLRSIVIYFRLTTCELAIRRQSSFDHSIADLEL